MAVLAMTTAATATLGMSPGAAQTSDPKLLLSSDGVTYAPAMTHPVFAAGTVLVPGASSSADIWVRNNTSDAAFLSVAAHGSRTGRELAAQLGLGIRSPLGSTARVPLSGTGSCSDLAVGWAIAPGESARLTLMLDMDRSASNASRGQSNGFDFRFLLEDQDASTRRGACASGAGTLAPGLEGGAPALPSAPGAPLAVTGVPDPLGWFLAAVVLLAAGTGTLVYMRRTKAGSDGED